MATVQMNVRIDDGLKRAGDEVIAAAGRTASEVVRAVWQRIALTGQLPEGVGHELAQGELDATTASGATPRELPDALAGPALVSAFLAERGAEGSDPGELDYDALLEEAWAERLSERGLA